MLLLAEISLSVLAIFGAYVLLRRLFVSENEMIFAVRRQKNTEGAELLRLVRRARADAWLCGRCRVILLDEDGREISEKRI